MSDYQRDTLMNFNSGGGGGHGRGSYMSNVASTSAGNVGGNGNRNLGNMHHHQHQQYHHHNLHHHQQSHHQSQQLTSHVPEKHTVHWFRKGLRLHDNSSLREGIRTSKTFRCIFVLDPWFAGSSNVGINKWR